MSESVKVERPRGRPGSDEVCTTQQAAEMLGISVTSVQQLVESGKLEAWKTAGGHRRIPLASVLAYRDQPAAAAREPERAARAVLSILLVEDNPMQRTLLETHLQRLPMPVQVRSVDNGYQALLDMAKTPPDVLLTDVVMEGIDGLEVVRTILSHPELAHVQVAILSALQESDLPARGGVPPGVVFFPKPVNFDELRGFLRACYAQQQKNQI